MKRISYRAMKRARLRRMNKMRGGYLFGPGLKGNIFTKQNVNAAFNYAKPMFKDAKARAGFEFVQFAFNQFVPEPDGMTAKTKSTQASTILKNVLAPRVSSQLDFLTRSRYTEGDYDEKAMEKMHMYQSISSTVFGTLNLQNAIGKQNTSDITLGSIVDLYNFALQAKAQYPSSPSGMGNSLKMFLECITIDCRISNSGNTPVAFDIYHYAPQKNYMFNDTDRMDAFRDAWADGLALQSGASGATMTYDTFSAQPSECSLVNTYFRLREKQPIDLAVGASHQHIYTFYPNRTITLDYLRYATENGTIGGYDPLYSRVLSFITSGVPIHDNTVTSLVSTSPGFTDIAYTITFRGKLVYGSNTITTYTGGFDTIVNGSQIWTTNTVAPQGTTGN